VPDDQPLEDERVPDGGDDGHQAGTESEVRRDQGSQPRRADPGQHQGREENDALGQSRSEDVAEGDRHGIARDGPGHGPVRAESEGGEPRVR
jgi:hypothetical protein